MVDLETLKKLEGKQTVQTVQDALGFTRQSTINFISSLKKQGYVTTSGGGKQKRIYTFSTKIIRKKKEGMFEILNKYSNEKIYPHFIHEPHFNYKVEHAIIDLIKLEDIRVLVNLLKLFNHVTNWSLLYTLAKENNMRKQVGALYDIARQFTKVKRMPKKTRQLMLNSNDKNNFSRSSNDFKDIENIWGVNIPFNKKDLGVYT
ncbi:hypothetical protein GOV08_03735 [Candidatus Woesearchaeota archaeon]|nr:hypothetical protein [Candidatus Woesearchaeota archaeon]